MNGNLQTDTQATNNNEEFDFNAYANQVWGNDTPANNNNETFTPDNDFFNAYSNTMKDDVETAIESNPTAATEALPDDNPLKNEALQAIDGGRDAEVNNNVANDKQYEQAAEALGIDADKEQKLGRGGNIYSNYGNFRSKADKIMNTASGRKYASDFGIDDLKSMSKMKGKDVMSRYGISKKEAKAERAYQEGKGSILDTVPSHNWGEQRFNDYRDALNREMQSLNHNDLDADKRMIMLQKKMRDLVQASRARQYFNAMNGKDLDTFKHYYSDTPEDVYSNYEAPEVDDADEFSEAIDFQPPATTAGNNVIGNRSASEWFREYMNLPAEKETAEVANVISNNDNSGERLAGSSTWSTNEYPLPDEEQPQPLDNKEEKKDKFISGSGTDLDTAKGNISISGPVVDESTWNDVKSTLASLHSSGSKPSAVPPTMQINGSTKGAPSARPIVQNVSRNIAGGHADIIPSTGNSTTSSFRNGPTSKMFNEIMSVSGPAFTQDGKKGTSGKFHSSLASQNSTGKGSDTAGGKALKLPGMKANAVSILDKIVEKLHHLPNHEFKKGILLIKEENGRIFIKFGSYRKVLLETFAKSHPDKLKYVWSLMS